MELMRFVSQPELKSPVAVIGFGGWPNAGEISTTTLGFFHQALDARPLAELDPDPFFDYTDRRPEGLIRDGKILSLNEPTGRLCHAADASGRQVLLFEAEEPQFKWRLYTDTLLETLERLRVKLVINIGGAYDERLHTDPPLVSFLAQEMVLVETLLEAGGVMGSYQGPLSIGTLVHKACRDRGLPVVSLWGYSPVYVQSGNFQVVAKIVSMIAALGGPAPGTGSLTEACLTMDQQLDEMIKNSPKLAEYVARIQHKPFDNGRLDHQAKLLSRGRGKVIPLNRFGKNDDLNN